MRDVSILSRAKGVKQMKGKGKKKGKKPRLAREIKGARHPYEEGTTNPHLKAAILEVVENQLRENNPPETRQTFERLLATGYPRQEAMEMIGSAVVGEIWAVLKENKPYDAVRFRVALEKVLEEG